MNSNLQPTQFILQEVDVNQNQFLSSYTDKNSLNAIFPSLRRVTDLTEDPMPMIRSAFQDVFNKGTSFLDLIDKEGGIEYIDNEFFKHRLKKDGYDYIWAIQDLNEDIECPGLGDDRILMKLNDGTLKYGDVIAPASFKEYPLRVESHRADHLGVGYVYEFSFFIADRNRFYPKDLLKAQVKWEKLFHAVGEATSLRGSFKTSMAKGWLEFGNNMTTISKAIEVTDKAQATFIIVDYTCGNNPNLDPNLPMHIAPYLEAEFLAQTRKEEQNVYMWGQANSAPLTNSSFIDDSSQKHVNVGSGFFQYAQYAIIEEYSTKNFNAEAIFKKMVSRVERRVRYSDFNWVLSGGKNFVRLFLNDLRKRFGAQAVTTTFSDVTKSAPAIDTTNREGFAFNTKQATRVMFEPYGSLGVEHIEELDSWQFMGPDLQIDGDPISSYWGFCFKLGLKGGRSKNFNRVIKRNSEVFAYVCGVWTPRGPMNSLTMEEEIKYKPGAAHRGAYYSLEWQKTLGYRMKDTSDMIWFIPAYGR